MVCSSGWVPRVATGYEISYHESDQPNSHVRCSDQNIIVTFYFHPFKVVVVLSLVPIPFSSSCVTMAHLHTILSVLCLFLVRATISISVNLEDPGTHQPLRIAY